MKNISEINVLTESEILEQELINELYARRDRVASSAMPLKPENETPSPEILKELTEEENIEYQDLVGKIKILMSKEFNRDFFSVTHETKLGDMDIDSLGFLEFLCTVEDEFHVDVVANGKDFPKTFGGMVRFLYDQGVR